MYRKLVPSRENSSLIIKSMGVEMIAGCILTPIMSMFSPGTYFTYLSYETLCENNKERKFNIFIFYVCVFFFATFIDHAKIILTTLSCLACLTPLLQRKYSQKNQQIGKIVTMKDLPKAHQNLKSRRFKTVLLLYTLKPRRQIIQKTAK
jgi:hypothetical protein